MNKAPSDPLIGRTVAQYDIVAKLGGGGMGVVYRAKDTKLGRTVALKFLPPQWSHDEGAKQRFLREAQAASATNHRNICVIHDIDETDDGQLFIVMAYYEGQTLKQKLEAGALPLTEALEFATEIAEGLARAHAQGVVHRDIKSGNVMVTDDGVKILDFGLAKFADALQLTIPGTTVGTVAYMSPEQARGEEADERSDIWALGVVLYEMLTGEVPFKGTYPEATFYAIKNEPPPPLGATGREIPEAVERIVLRALEKDPARRFQGARELARDLRLLQGRTVPLELRTEELPAIPSVRPPGPLPLGRRVRNALTPARAAAAGAVVIAAAVGSYFWLTRPVVRIPIAIAPVANHTGEPEIDTYRLALTAALVSELGESPNIRVTSYLRVLEMIRRFVSGAGDISGREAIQAISTGSGARFVVVPALAYRNGAWFAQAEIRSVDTGTNVGTIETPAVTSSLPKDTVYRLMAALAAAVQGYFRAQWPQRAGAGRSAGGRFRSLEAAGAFEQGLNAYEKMEYSAALAALQRAVKEDAQRALAHAWVSRVLLLMGQSREAEAAAQRAAQLVTGETPRTDALLASALLAEARADSSAAEARYRELAALQPDDPVAHAELAGFLKRQGRNQEAVGAYREVLRRDAGYVRPHVDLCQIYVQLDDNPLAEEEAGKALEKFRAAGDRGGEAQALLCLGDAQRKQGGARVVEGRRSIESARGLFESLDQPYALCRVYQYLGIVADAERNFPAAARAFEEALTRSRQIGNRTIEGLALMNLGVTYESLGQRARVLQYYEQSRDFYQQTGDERRAAEEETNVAGVLVNYGSNHDEALRRLANARVTLRKLGQVEFDAYAMELEALSLIRAGRHTEGIRQLREALSFAKERQLTKRIASLTIAIAQSHFLTNEYEAARGLLESLTAGDTERGNWEAFIALGRTYLRLGDFTTAAKHLERALGGIESSGEMSLAPPAYAALGELAYESGRLPAARGYFDKAAVLWTGDLPDAASVEAGCYRGLIDAQSGSAAAAASVQTSVEQAARMGRLHVEVRCRLDLARIQFRSKQYSDALASLNKIPLDGQRAIGPELEAEGHDWRGRTLAELNDRARADSEAAQARMLMQKLQAALPEAYRHGFASRVDISPLLQ